LGLGRCLPPQHGKHCQQSNPAADLVAGLHGERLVRRRRGRQPAGLS
jgi:hypothetical protein